MRHHPEFASEHNIQILFIRKYNRKIPRSHDIRGTYESLIFSSAFDLAIYSVFIAQFECPISGRHVLLVFSRRFNRTISFSRSTYRYIHLPLSRFLLESFFIDGPWLHLVHSRPRFRCGWLPSLMHFFLVETVTTRCQIYLRQLRKFTDNGRSRIEFSQMKL